LYERIRVIIDIYMCLHSKKMTSEFCFICYFVCGWNV